MTREQFKMLAAGKFVQLSSSYSTGIDKEKLDTFVDGAVFGWDMANKEAVENNSYSVGKGIYKIDTSATITKDQ